MIRDVIGIFVLSNIQVILIHFRRSVQPVCAPLPRVSSIGNGRTSVHNEFILSSEGTGWHAPTAPRPTLPGCSAGHDGTLVSIL